MKKILSLLLLFVLALPLFVFGAGAQMLRDQMLIRSLQGIDSMNVIVEDIEEEYKRAGFSRTEYKNTIELRLRSLGIRIDESSSSYLYLNINPSRVGPLPAFAVCVRLSFNQRVLLIRDATDDQPATRSVVASIWERSSVAAISENRVDYVKGVTIELVDLFANDYLKANPPEPRSGQGGE